MKILKRFNIFTFFILISMLLTGCDSIFYSGSGGGRGNTQELPKSKITYLANGATSGSVPEAEEISNYSDYRISENSGELKREGFVFTGWNTTIIGDGAHYNVGQSIVVLEDLNLYAEWEELPPMVPHAKLKKIGIKINDVVEVVMNEDGEYTDGFYYGDQIHNLLAFPGYVLNLPVYNYIHADLIHLYIGHDGIKQPGVNISPKFNIRGNNYFILDEDIGEEHYNSFKLGSYSEFNLDLENEYLHIPLNESKNEFSFKAKLDFGVFALRDGITRLITNIDTVNKNNPNSNSFDNNNISVYKDVEFTNSEGETYIESVFQNQIDFEVTNLAFPEIGITSFDLKFYFDIIIL